MMVSGGEYCLARSTPFSFKARAVYITPGLGWNLDTISSIRAICGVYFGLTKDPMTICFSPVSDSASSNSTFWSTGMFLSSICMPSRMPSSV